MLFRQRGRDGGKRCGISSLRLGFRQAFVDHAEQRRWPEGLAQAPRRTEAEGHFEAGKILGFRTRKGVTGNCDQRDRRRADEIF